MREVIARTERKWSGEITHSCNVLQIKNGEVVTEVKGLSLLAAIREYCFMISCTETKL